MEFKFVNPKSVDRLIGKYAPISSFVLARIIEEALDNTNLGFVHTQAGVGRLKSDPPEISEALVGVVDRMLAHNQATKNRPLWRFFDELDFDLVHEVSDKPDGSGKTVSTTVKAYFYHRQFIRPEHERRVVFHLVYNEIGGTKWDISFPVQVVMKGFPHIEDEHVGYCHGIALVGPDGRLSGVQHNYIGVTKRNWLQRMAEHFNEIKSGSNKAFHSAWRQYIGKNSVRLLSELVVVNHTFEQIMAWEEYQVDREMVAGTSLNMIPGGFKGMRYLHEHRLTSSTIVPIEDRDKAIERFQSLHPRAGIPNLLISQLWNNSEYAEQVICGAEGRLSPDQVRRIRELNAAGIPVEKIIDLVGAKNLLQVERVLSGVTYSRIH